MNDMKEQTIEQRDAERELERIARRNSGLTGSRA